MQSVFNITNKTHGPIEGLTCVVQNYAWGKCGAQSLAGRLKKQSDSAFDLDDNTPFAEYWIGTHPNGPARMSKSGEKLSDYLKTCNDAVGVVPSGYPPDDLPFMMKVLSIKTALSIQSHPDKVLAQMLHKTYPDIYKDPNHKPEMAVALTQFEAMCGFRLISEIKTNILQFPELRAVLGYAAEQFLDDTVTDESDEDIKREALRYMLRSFMECADDFMNIQILAMISRLSSLQSEMQIETESCANGHIRTSSTSTANHDNEYVQQLILRLHYDYPKDRGVMCPLLLNCLRLNAGEAFFMGPNEPHSYISGDIVECMALSDNTVRAGLTPKFKDVDTLCSMLHYRSGKPSSLLTPVYIDKYTQLYRPPISECAEFEVERCIIPANTETVNSPPSMACGSLLLVCNGSARIASGDVVMLLPEGSVVFVPPHTVLSISTNDEDVMLFRSHANMTWFNDKDPFQIK